MEACLQHEQPKLNTLAPTYLYKRKKIYMFGQIKDLYIRAVNNKRFLVDIVRILNRPLFYVTKDEHQYV